MQSCTEAKVIDNVKLFFLDWDADLTNLIQGHGHIMSIVDPLFLSQSNQNKKTKTKNKEMDHMNEKTGPAYYLLLRVFFHHEVGEKLTKLACEQ